MIAAHALKSAAIAAGVPYDLLPTITEFLFRLQWSKEARGGRVGVCRTGAQMAQQLGYRPRTFNSHVRRLAAAGWLDYELGPGPQGYPLRATWMFPTSKSNALVVPIIGQQDAQAKVSATDNQSPVVAATFDVSTLGNEENVFAAEQNASPAESSVSKEHVEKLRAAVEAECKMKGYKKPRFNAKVDAPALTKIALKLAGDSFSKSDQVSVLRAAVHDWESFREGLPPNYSEFAYNLFGPTYVALHKGIRGFAKVWREQQHCQQS